MRSERTGERPQPPSHTQPGASSIIALRTKALAASIALCVEELTADIVHDVARARMPLLSENGGEGHLPKAMRPGGQNASRVEEFASFVSQAVLSREPRQSCIFQYLVHSLLALSAAPISEKLGVRL